MTIAIISVMFYFRQFRQSELRDYDTSNSSVPIANYISFKIEEKTIYKTTSQEGIIDITDDCLCIQEYAEMNIKVGECFSVGKQLGINQEGTPQIANFCGCLINIEEQESTYVCTFLNYNLINFEFEFDKNLHNNINYHQTYECMIGGTQIHLSLNNIIYDYSAASYIAIFRIVSQDFNNDFYIFNGETCNITIMKEEYMLNAVDKNILSYINLNANDEFEITLRDENNNFSKALIKITVIGDSYIGLSSNIELNGNYLCVGNRDDRLN